MAVSSQHFVLIFQFCIFRVGCIVDVLVDEAGKMDVGQNGKGLAGLAGIDNEAMLLRALQDFEHLAGYQAIRAEDSLVGLGAGVPDPSLSEHRRMKLYSVLEHFEHLLLCLLVEVKLFIGNRTIHHLVSQRIPKIAVFVRKGNSLDHFLSPKSLLGFL